MWMFPMMFWLVPVLLFALSARRRRWRRWGMIGPDGYPIYVVRDERMVVAGPPRRGLDEQERGMVELLESRIAELEQRLDFTERLLAGRREHAPTS